MTYEQKINGNCTLGHTCHGHKSRAIIILSYWRRSNADGSAGKWTGKSRKLSTNVFSKKNSFAQPYSQPYTGSYSQPYTCPYRRPYAQSYAQTHAQSYAQTHTHH